MPMATRKPSLGLGRSKQLFVVSRCPDQKNKDRVLSGIGHGFLLPYPAQLNNITGTTQFIGRFGHTKIELNRKQLASIPWREGSDNSYVN